MKQEIKDMLTCLREAPLTEHPPLAVNIIGNKTILNTGTGPINVAESTASVRDESPQLQPVSQPTQQPVLQPASQPVQQYDLQPDPSPVQDWEP